MRRWTLAGALLIATLLVACTTTRQVTAGHAKLRSPGHRSGFDAKAKITPNSQLRFFNPDHGWSPWVWASAVHVSDDGLWVKQPKKLGWRWQDMGTIEVKNFSGGKTIGALVGISAVAVVIVIPAMLLGAAFSGMRRGGDQERSGSSSSSLAKLGSVFSTSAADPSEARWHAHVVDDGTFGSRPLFTTASRVRSIVRLTAAVDTMVAKDRDYVASGVVARLRLLDFIELGAGVRAGRTQSASGAWTTATAYVFQGGVHLPLDAGERFSLPMGFEVGGGNGAIERDLRLLWGIRHAWGAGRWSATLQPATASYVRRADSPSGRWSLGMGGDLGFSF